MRKIIQLTVMPPQSQVAPSLKRTLIALCEDGSVWETFEKMGANGLFHWEPWERLPELPEEAHA